MCLTNLPTLLTLKQVIVLNDYITLSLQFSLSFPALRSIDFGGEIDYAPSLNSQRIVGRGKIE